MACYLVFVWNSVQSYCDLFRVRLLAIPLVTYLCNLIGIQTFIAISKRGLVHKCQQILPVCCHSQKL